jgi:hypothetical protein
MSLVNAKRKTALAPLYSDVIRDIYYRQDELPVEVEGERKRKAGGAEPSCKRRRTISTQGTEGIVPETAATEGKKGKRFAINEPGYGALKTVRPYLHSKINLLTATSRTMMDMRPLILANPNMEESAIQERA